MLAVPLKHGDKASWNEQLTGAIAHVYGSANEFRREIDALDSMRDAALGVSANATGRDLLYKYYAQLELLALHVPLQPFKLVFTWHDLYDRDSVEQPALAFEKACILFNLAAVLSQLGVDAASTDYKHAYHFFSCAAGIFGHISENFLHLACTDLSVQTLNALKTLMLAQAQHCFFLKASQSEGPGALKLVPKLGAAAQKLYVQALDMLSELYDNGWGDKASLKQLDSAITEVHVNTALAESKRLEQEFKYGSAMAHLKEIKQFLSKDEAKDLQTRIDGLEKDNNLIYHDREPFTPPAIAETVVAKPLPLDAIYPSETDLKRVVGRDLFEKMVPVSVHKLASVYSELQAELLRAEQEKVDIADMELNSALEYMDLPAAAARLKQQTKVEVPEEVYEWSEIIKSRPISTIRTNFDDQRARILSKLSSDGSSIPISQSLVNAKRSDANLQALVLKLQPELKVLMSLDLVKAAYVQPKAPNILDLDLVDKPIDADLEKVSQLVVELRKISSERQLSLKELRQALKNDDVTQLLVAHQNSEHVIEKLLKPELKKFDSFINRISTTIRLQTAVMNGIAELWNQILESDAARKRVAEEKAAILHMETVTTKFRTVYEEYLQICDASAKAQQFYDSLELQTRSPRAPPVPAKPKPAGLSGYTTPSAYDPSMYR